MRRKPTLPTVRAATGEHPPNNSPAANYIAFSFRKTYRISAGNISSAYAHIALPLAKYIRSPGNKFPRAIRHGGKVLYSVLIRKQIIRAKLVEFLCNVPALYLVVGICKHLDRVASVILKKNMLLAEYGRGGAFLTYFRVFR